MELSFTIVYAAVMGVELAPVTVIPVTLVSPLPVIAKVVGTVKSATAGVSAETIGAAVTVNF